MKKNAKTDTAVHCRVELADLHAHLYRVTLTIARPAADQRVALPVWIPGSYLVREFSRHLQHLKARQGERAVALTQLDKCTWQAASRTGQPLVLSYEVYAFDNSVRTAWLDSTRGFFNATSLCLRAEGQDDAPHALEVVPSKAVPGWSLATGLTPLKVNRKGFGTYLAAGYDELADCPVETGHVLERQPSRPAVFRTGLWWPARRRHSTANGCCRMCRRSAKPKSGSGMARRRAPGAPTGRRSRATCSCSTPWTTATAAWSTATPPP